MPVGWAITVVILCVAVVALAVVLLGLLRQITPVLEQLAATGSTVRTMGPDVGSPLPHFAVRSPGGEVTDEKLRGRTATLLFLSAGCGPCKTLAQEMRSADLNGLTDQLVIITGPDGLAELAIPEGLRVLIEADREVSGPLSVMATPFAVSVDQYGIVKATLVPNTVNDLTSVVT
jgi:hypothetical protein